MSEISLGDALTQLAPAITNAGPTDPIIPPSLNDLLQRFYNELDFVGKISPDYPLTVHVDVSGYQTIGLPGRYQTAEYLHDSCGDLPIQNEFKKYIEEPWCNTGYNAQDLGDGFPTFFDMPYLASLFVNTVASVTGSPTLYVSGLDANGYPISETINLSSGGATSAKQYTRILSLKKTAVTCETLLFYIPTTGSNVLMGQYDPNEVYPQVRRYYINRAPNNASVIYAKLRRRFIAVVNNTDMIVPGNIPALYDGLLSIKARNEGQYTRQEEQFQSAKRALDGELSNYIGEAQTGTFELSRNAPMAYIDNMP